MSDHPPETLFELLNSSLCTDEQITAVLQRLHEEFKDDPNMTVRISGKKEEKVENLRKVASQSPKALIDAVNLLRDAEENGRQHVYFYEPTTRAVKRSLADGQAVAISVFGPHWQKKVPNYGLKPEGLVLADFRYNPPAPGRDYWTIKVYGHKTEWKPLEVEYLDDGNRKRREWIRIQQRSVYLLKFNRHGVVEVRTPRGGSVTQDQEHLENAWTLVHAAVNRDEFKPLCLESARRNLFRRRNVNSSRYRTGKVNFLDSNSASVTCCPATDEESIDHEAAAAAVMLNDSDTTHLQQLYVNWIGQRIESVHRDGLGTIVGGHHSNRLSIASRSEQIVVDHVIDELLKHNA